MSEQETKLKEFFERARKGVLKHLEVQGGMLSLADLHDYSLKTYFIQHQRFSIMMEGFVAENLVIYDETSSEVIISDMGKKFIQ